MLFSCHSLWSRITARAAPLVQKRFLVNFDAFLGSVAQQAVYRKRKAILDIKTYLVARRDNGATRPCCALAELAADIELPEHVWGHPTMRRLEDAAVDLIDLANGEPSMTIVYRWDFLTVDIQMSILTTSSKLVTTPTTSSQ